MLPLTIFPNAFLYHDIERFKQSISKSPCFDDWQGMVKWLRVNIADAKFFLGTFYTPRHYFDIPLPDEMMACIFGTLRNDRRVKVEPRYYFKRYTKDATKKWKEQKSGWGTVPFGDFPKEIQKKLLSGKEIEISDVLRPELEKSDGDLR